MRKVKRIENVHGQGKKKIHYCYIKQCKEDEYSLGLCKKHFKILNDYASGKQKIYR